MGGAVATRTTVIELEGYSPPEGAFSLRVGRDGLRVYGPATHSCVGGHRRVSAGSYCVQHRAAHLRRLATLAEQFRSPPRLRYNRRRLEGRMTDVEQIEQQIEHLDDQAFARLRLWFLEYDHARWDRQVEADSAAGKLDFLAEEARAEHRAGKTRPL